MPGTGYDLRPDYRVDLLPRRNLVRITLHGREIAASRRTILVDEQDHGLVFYVPRADVAADRLVPLGTLRTHCPFKGDADHFAAPEDPATPIAWTYPRPLLQVAAIAGHIAFYQDRVTVTVGAA